MSKPEKRFVLASVKPGDSIPWSNVHDDPEIVYYDDDSNRVSETGAECHEVPYCTYGDYDNSSAVERSNYRVLLANHPESLVEVHGDHGSAMLLYLGALEDQTEDLQDVIKGLESYPLVDESDHSELEREMESEAWSDWGREDFRRALVKHLTSVTDGERAIDGDAIDDALLDSLWWDGVDAYNVNGGSGMIVESGGNVHFYIREWITSAALEAARSEWGFAARAAITERLAALVVDAGTIIAGASEELDVAIECMVHRLVECLWSPALACDALDPIYFDRLSDCWRERTGDTLTTTTTTEIS